MIVAAHAGTGKTTFAKLYPDIVIDFVAMPYKYYLRDSDNPEPEKSKASYSILDMQLDWPENYFEAIKKILGEQKIVLIPPVMPVLTLLGQEQIPYVLCYPERGAKEVYRKRYADRGNTDEFLSIFVDDWDFFLDSFENDTHGKHIVMQPHQYLSDVIDIPTLLDG